MSNLIVKSYQSLVSRGGPGSGHFEHAGRPGVVGGSQPSDFHSSPGKKGWGRPRDHSDGTTMVDGKRTFIRGWDQKALDEIDAIDDELKDAREHDVRLNGLTAKDVWMGRIIMDYYADATRLHNAVDPTPAPIETLLPSILKAVEALGRSDRKHASVYADAAERAGRLLDAIDEDPDFIKNNRAGIILGFLGRALQFEVYNPSSSEWDPSVSWGASGQNRESPFLKALGEDLISPAMTLLGGVKNARADEHSVRVARDEMMLDQAMSEDDWRRWDSVYRDMEKAESVRQAVLKTGAPQPSRALSNYQALMDENRATLRRREEILSSPDPDRRYLEVMERGLLDNQTTMLHQQDAVVDAMLGQARGNVTALVKPFGGEPVPELVKIKVVGGEPGVDWHGRPAGYFGFIEGEEMEQAEAHAAIARAFLSTVVSPELLDSMPMTDVWANEPTFAGGYGHTHYNQKEGVIGIEKASRYNSVAHETVHVLEHGSDGLRKLGWMFYRYRGGGDKAIISGSGHPQRPDRFSDTYSGRVYTTSVLSHQSEVVSTAVGQMITNPALFAASDPEFFNFTVTALRGDWLREETP